MSKISPRDLVHWMGSHDLAGIGAITEISDTLVSEAADHTSITDPFTKELPTGVRIFTLTESGFMDESNASLRGLLMDTRPEGGWDTIIGKHGARRGAPVRLASGMEIKSEHIPPAKGQFTKAHLEYAHGDDGEVWEGRLSSPGTRVNNGPNAPFQTTQVDLGVASHARHLVPIIMVDGIDWDGATALRIRVVHSNNATSSQGRNWDAIAELNVSAPAVRGYIRLPQVALTRRYLATRWDWTGGTKPNGKIITAVGIIEG